MKEAQNKLTALDSRIGELPLVKNGWSAKIRDHALTRIKNIGLAHFRDEYWRYTNPTPFSDTAVVPTPALTDATGLTDQFFNWSAKDDSAPIKIVFVDGVFDEKQSSNLSQIAGFDVTEPETKRLKAVELEIDLLQKTLSRDIHWAKNKYGQLEAAGQKPVSRSMATFNTAFAQEGVLIRVTKKVDRPVMLIYQQENDRSDVLLHHYLQIEADAKLTLIETGTAAARFSHVLEADIAQAGQFHHIRLQPQNNGIAHTHLFIRLAADALCKSFTLTNGGTLTRNEAVITLAGENSIAHIAGTYIGQKNAHHDDTVFISHNAPKCESRQVFKKVVKDGATAVFQGKIFVDQIAQKTDGYQKNQSLLLDDGSQIFVKPELEIYADDVQCSHGATSGAIDDNALFYLQSRGIPQEEAKKLLILAFLAETLDEIDDPKLAEPVLSQLEGWLS